MTKVLHIITDKNIGGAGHQLLALINAADSAAFKMEVILPENSQLVPLFAERSIICHEVPNIADKSFSLAGVKTLHAMIKQLKPDIVHTHGSMAGRAAARLCRVRVVHTRHSVFPVAAWKKRFSMRQLSGLLNNGLSDLVIAVSPAARENLLEMGTSDRKIRTVFNGTPPVKIFTPEETEKLKQKYNIPPDAFVLAIIARLTEVKGHDDVLDAAKTVSNAMNAGPEALILVAGNDGDGSNRRLAHLERRIADEGIANVRLLGFIKDVDELIAVSDALLNASYGTEASSMSLVQGMSAGRPAVVTDYGGNPYIVQDGINGLVTPTRDPLAMADAIIRLKSDPKLYRQLSDGARQRYAGRFTDKKMAADTEAVYNELSGR